MIKQIYRPVKSFGQRKSTGIYRGEYAFFIDNRFYPPPRRDRTNASWRVVYGFFWRYDQASNPGGRFADIKNIKSYRYLAEKKRNPLDLTVSV